MDRVHRERTLHGDQAAHPAVAGFELHAGDAVRGLAGARATVALQVHAQQPELTDGRSEVRREIRLLEPFAHARRDAGGDERANGVPNHPLLIREETVESEEVAG